MLALANHISVFHWSLNLCGNRIETFECDKYKPNASKCRSIVLKEVMRLAEEIPSYGTKEYSYEFKATADSQVGNYYI
jgi:hypothetical protein